jgi:hypothetical protein
MVWGGEVLAGAPGPVDATMAGHQRSGAANHVVDDAVEGRGVPLHVLLVHVPQSDKTGTENRLVDEAGDDRSARGKLNFVANQNGHIFGIDFPLAVSDTNRTFIT